MIDAAVLARPLAALLGTAAFDLRSWTVEPVRYRTWSRSSGGVQLVSGDAFVDGVLRQWRMVLKINRYRPWTPTPDELMDQCDDGGDGSGDWSDWTREAAFLRSGLAGALPPGLRTPRCLTVQDVAPDRTWLWFEAIEGKDGTTMSADDVVALAGELGAFHAAHLGVVRDEAWFCRPFVEQPNIHRLAEKRYALTDPRLGSIVPPSLASMVDELWAHHAAAVCYLRALPQTVCHRDLTPANLLRPGGRETVVVDWGQVGRGPAAEDLATLVLSWFFATQRPLSGLAELVDAVVHSHTAAVTAAARPASHRTSALVVRLIAAFHHALPVCVAAHRSLVAAPAPGDLDNLGQAAERSAVLLAAVRSDLADVAGGVAA